VREIQSKINTYHLKSRQQIEGRRTVHHRMARRHGTFDVPLAVTAQLNPLSPLVKPTRD